MRLPNLAVGHLPHASLDATHGGVSPSYFSPGGVGTLNCVGLPCIPGLGCGAGCRCICQVHGQADTSTLQLSQLTFGNCVCR
jgi:hypothetical protein